MPRKPWYAEKFTNLDKRIVVHGPNEMLLYVDFDDVNHVEVRRELRQMLKVLNEG